MAPKFRWKTLKHFIETARSVWLVAPTVSATVIIGHSLGAFNLLEWSIRDQFFRWRPLEPIEKRIIVVTVDEPDIQAVGDWPITDAVLAQLLTNIREQNPRVIGLDLYRDLPEEPGHQDLLEVFKTTPQLIGVEKVTENQVAPPPILEEQGQVAIADMVLDEDRNVRRALLSLNDPETGSIKSGLATQVALNYLKTENIVLEPVNAEKQHFKLGETIFRPMVNGVAGYTQVDLAGYQVLMNWYGPSNRFRQISMQDVLANNIPPDLMRDRIVYIGSTAISTNDFFPTPYNGGFRSVEGPMAGVFVHANITSLLIESALTNRPLLHGWPQKPQWIWIIFWAILGTLGTWHIEFYNHQEGRNPHWIFRPTITTAMGGMVLLGGGYLGFLLGCIIPLIPPLAAFALSAGVTTNIFKKQRLQLANQQLEFVNKQLLDYAATLEAKVKDRTHELAEAKQVADQANQAKSEFLANMSHELRTPLNGILGYAQILEQSKMLPEESRGKVSIIHQCGSHLLTLINDILDISKIEARKLELFLAEADLHAILWGITEMFKMRAKQKGITFNLNIDSDLPQIVVIDEKRFRQVLINLIGNAIKFTDQGSVDLNVTLQEKRDHQGNNINQNLSTERIRFSVQDTGIGMEASQIEKIFLPFEQVGEHRRKAEGTGLGLAISQQILVLMGSELQVKSQLGQGSLFWTDLDLTVKDTGAQQRRLSTFEKIAGIQGKTPNILIVEDSREDCYLMTHFLQSIGCMTQTAIDGLTGLAMAKQHRPDLIITDLIMQNFNGVEFLEALRKCPPLKNTPVIVVSASVFNGDKEKSLAAGATEFLPKPLDFSTLLDILQAHLNLEWVYTSTPESTRAASGYHSPPSPDTPIVPPDLDMLKELYHLAMMGNLNAIEGKLKEIEAKECNAYSFVLALGTLVENFQVKQIKTFLQSYLPSDYSL